jgi:hypothetical protein
MLRISDPLIYITHSPTPADLVSFHNQNTIHRPLTTYGGECYTIPLKPSLTSLMAQRGCTYETRGHLCLPIRGTYPGHHRGTTAFFRNLCNPYSSLHVLAMKAVLVISCMFEKRDQNVLFLYPLFLNNI